jgi:quinoprotein glucose dehydrogenase
MRPAGRSARTVFAPRFASGSGARCRRSQPTRLPTPTSKSLVAYLSNPAAGAIPRTAATWPAAGSSAPWANAFLRTVRRPMARREWIARHRPPWSEIVAYDLNEGTIKWRTPLGTVASLAEKGHQEYGQLPPTAMARSRPPVDCSSIATRFGRQVHALRQEHRRADCGNASSKRIPTASPLYMNPAAVIHRVLRRRGSIV